MNNPVYGITMENLRNRIDVQFLSKKKVYIKWTPKPSSTPHKIFDNDLPAIYKSKVTLTLKRPAYIRMCMLELSKALIHEFYYESIKINILTTQDYYSQTLIV